MNNQMVITKKIKKIKKSKKKQNKKNGMMKKILLLKKLNLT